MIKGVVNARREAVVQLRLRGPTGIETQVDALIDSGFTASLALPALVVSTMGLLRQSSGSAMLADGSIRPFDICAAEVQWDGAWKSVLVYEAGDEALLGMRLLADHRLIIDVVPGGAVQIAPLRGSPAKTS
jgi:clan AA aspartic protease